MPDNIEYAYLGYAATLIGLGALIAWIYYRWAMLRREHKMLDRLEAEIAAERSAERAGEPAASPAASEPAPQSSPQGAAATET